MGVRIGDYLHTAALPCSLRTSRSTTPRCIATMASGIFRMVSYQSGIGLPSVSLGEVGRRVRGSRQ